MDDSSYFRFHDSIYLVEENILPVEEIAMGFPTLAKFYIHIETDPRMASHMSHFKAI